MESQIKELENTSRIVKNIYSLIMDSEYKGNLSHIVAEAVSFLDAFQKNVDGEIDNMRFELKRQAESKQE